MFEHLKFAASLGSDNHSGVHPRVMQAMLEANRGHAHAYGLDELCRLTHHEFARVFGEAVEPHYVFTGTAANVLSFAGQVKSFEAIVVSSVSHMQLDECGAPEKFLNAKLLTVPTTDGRMRPAQALTWLERAGDQHYAQPRAVSLTQPTELGLCYRLEELREWRAFTRSKNLMLHVDGARLANSAAYLGCTLRDLCGDLGVDVVSLGGTKNGSMGAEAVLLFSAAAKADFKFYRKQALQLSSKTRFLAAQFYAYLKDDLWLDIANHVTSSARDLARRLVEFPEIRLAFPVESNGLFVQLPKAWIGPLRDKRFFYVWDSEINLCRWMISFDWTPADTDQWIETIREVRQCFPVK